MIEDIVIPAMGESITEAVISTILKPSGSFIKMDEEILELETDKVNQALYAKTSGVITLNVKEQDVVKIGDVIGCIDSEKAPLETKPEPEKPKDVPPPPAPPPPAPPQAPAPKKTPVIENKTIVTHTETRKKLPKIRQVIAERLVEAQHTAAMLTTFNEVDLTAVNILRDKYKELFQKKYDVKLGYMSFFVKAAVSALKLFPEVNAYLDGDDLVYRNYFDLSIAVSTERGLVVPVIRDCDKLSFAEIEKEVLRFTTSAKEGTLSLDDLKGGGFTITNGGVFGSLLSTPILNPPQSAILGMHKIMKRPIAVNDQVVISPMMYLALTYDHRIIDGKEAVSFLVHIKECLEDPSRLLLKI